MNYIDLNNALETLSRSSLVLEEAYIESEGECTEQTEQMEEEISALRDLLTSEGVDLLGRWLKAKEDAKKALKAEKDYVTRKMAALDQTIDFIKVKVNEVLTATGQDKVKGSLGYSFAATTSVKTSVDKDILNDTYLAQVEEAVKGILPEDVTITLGASVSKVEEGTELPAYYNRTETPSVRFTKPRASKE